VTLIQLRLVHLSGHMTKHMQHVTLIQPRLAHSSGHMMKHMQHVTHITAELPGQSEDYPSSVCLCCKMAEMSLYYSYLSPHWEQRQ